MWRSSRVAAALSATALLVAVAGCGGSGSSSGKTQITVWEGYTDVEGKAFNKLADEFNSSHKDIDVKVLETNNDYALQKVLTAVRGGTPPDVAYLYGSWAPNVAKIPTVVDLTSTVKSKAVNWNDFYPGERAVTTVDGKVIGMPALVDNLAIVYNKSLFKKAGVTPPSANWTWDDFRAAAKKLTDPATKQYGTSYPADASEDSVWHWEAMLWEAGGQILNSSNTKAAFNSPEGQKAMTTLKQMAVDDKSMYVDTTNSKYMDLFNAGKIGMLVTGPWDLSSVHVPYGVQIMPTYAGSSAGHQSISGPDNWVLFNNGSDRVQAAKTFVTWLTAPAQVKEFSLATGDLPTRKSIGDDQSVVSQMNDKLPGLDVYIHNLSNVKQARPQVTAYPKISESLGNSIVGVLLGKLSPQAALSQSASATDQALASGS
ncbi:MAG TPA: ABC transporter substrate-binding protein [Mycobacterium sp.]|nr:ABC transporter substrate-binding protein [Mycobacterium sp.]